MFSGAITAMITPFRDGRLDEGRLRERVEFQVTQGIDALVPVGTTGESPTLAGDERRRVIELTVTTARGRVPVIAGVGSNSTTDALEMHEFAKHCGATAGLSVNPYYNKPSQEGLYRHFMTLAERVDLPIVLYNIPGRTGCHMSAQTVARLRNANPQRFVAIKEASGSLDQSSEIMGLCDMPVLSGDDSLTVGLMSLGARGVVSVVSNLLPTQIKRMTRAALCGDFTEARAVHQRLFPLTRALFADGNPAGIKHAMKLAGMDSGEMRLPLVDTSEPAQRVIEEHMRKLELL